MRKFFVIFVLFDIILPLGQVFADETQEHFDKGHRFYLESKSAEAEVEFRKALRINPGLSEAHYYLGSICFKQERYSGAIEQCKQGLKINPEDLKTLIILGLSLQQIGLHNEAISTLQKAVSVDNQSAAAHSALGLAYCAGGHFTEAREEYNILKEIDPELADDLLQRIIEVEGL